MLYVSGLWAADLVRSPLPSRSSVFLECPLTDRLPLNGIFDRSISVFRSAQMFWRAYFAHYLRPQDYNGVL